MILLDIHVLLWLAGGDSKLGRRALALIAASEESLRISAMSYWECAMLSRKGRLTFSKPVAHWLDEAIRKGGIEVVPVTPAIAADAGSLPDPIHSDPSDRIIMATARMLGCPLATSDGKILDYAESGHIQAIDARR